MSTMRVLDCQFKLQYILTKFCIFLAYHDNCRFIYNLVAMCIEVPRNVVANRAIYSVIFPTPLHLKTNSY